MPHYPPPFINKFDQPGRDPLSLLDEIQRLLQIDAAPLNWPVGEGSEFAALFDRRDGRLHGPKGDLLDAGQIRPGLWNEAREHLSLLDGVGLSFETQRFLLGEQTPVFFGSALKGIGVGVLLDALVDLAPSPRARQSSIGAINPATVEFSGLVFKIQANMDPRHRDRVAFIRVCSGKFTKDMLLLPPTLTALDSRGSSTSVLCGKPRGRSGRLSGRRYWSDQSGRFSARRRVN